MKNLLQNTAIIYKEIVKWKEKEKESHHHN